MRYCKTILIAILLSVVSLAWALPPKPSAAFNGFYLSAGLSSVSRMTDFTMMRWTSSGAFFSNNSSVNTVGASIALGYQQLVRHWLLGGDIVARYIPGKSSGTALNNIHTPTISVPCLIGLEATPGYLLAAHTALYGILGLEWTKFRIRQQFDNSNFTFTRRQLGLGLGVGMATALNQHFLLQLAYLYIHYQRFRHPDPANALTMMFLPRIHIITLALAYRFK